MNQRRTAHDRRQQQAKTAAVFIRASMAIGYLEAARAAVHGSRHLASSPHVGERSVVVNSTPALTSATPRRSEAVTVSWNVNAEIISPTPGTASNVTETVVTRR